MQAETIRIVKFLSQSGVASCRGAGDLVLAGRVAVNGRVVTEPGTQIFCTDTVTLDGQVLQREDRKYYIMLNKPRGYVCSAEDRFADKLARDLIDLPVRLFSAGRLDKDSEGMLILSNDGDFIAHLTHPSFGIRKRYIVTLSRGLTRGEIRRLLNGIADGGEFLRALAVRAVGEKQYMLTLGEGKKREIRRMTAALGAPTQRLRRVAVGTLEMGDLPVGKWRELSPEECRQAMNSASISE